MKILLIVLSVALGLTPGLVAEESGSSADGVSVTAADDCASGFWDQLEVGPAADAQPAAGCPAAFCTNDAQCQSNCPSAQSAVCVNSVCQYSFSGGGGGGGPACPQSFCSGVLDCWNACPQANGVDCVGSVCQYW